MFIDCPCCGARYVSEFVYVGDAAARRPALGDHDAGRWYEGVYVRANPRGAHEEIWQHVHGCRQHLIVHRDTLSHAISEVRLAQAARAVDGEHR
ncbi:MAG: sarcosine oxidase subunit delta [Geminicoccaceae bacterium]